MDETVLGRALPPPLFRAQGEPSATYHARAVAELTSRGWLSLGFRAAVVLALVNDARTSAELAALARPCAGTRCVCPGEGWFPAASDAFPFQLVPDAYRIDGRRRVQVAEVNVTHHGGPAKWAAVLDSLDFDGWRFDLLTIDCHGGRVLYEHGEARHLPGARP